MFIPSFLLKKLPLYIVSALIFIVLSTSFITSFESKYRLSSSSLHHWLAEFSGEALVYVLGFENRYFAQVLPEQSKPPSMSAVMLELATSIKPGDIRSLLGNELPGFAQFDSTIVVAGEGTDYTNIAHESPPPIEFLMDGKEAEVQNVERLEDPDLTENPGTPPSAQGKKVAYIYHSHSWESFIPHLKGVKNPDNAVHSKVNITMVGKKLGAELEKRGIGTVVDTTNMTELLRKNNTDYKKSYPMARTLVQEAMAGNSGMTMLFDLHRDSLGREKTTREINGKNYAKILFVVGASNPNYEKNEQMAKELHALLQKKYPGLSRGVIKKNKQKGNGVYNQDLSSQAMLIEFGGVGNSFDELNRSAEAVAEAIADYYFKGSKQ
ncbi:stage II sporulation protein P [Fictibacillus iocasae]|uniref:Stage II sporulation protein P n=1 Tax=Fictibacillus iocasae TaxID=2715437 RepID=A0ABW2NI76_9BACL